MESEKRIVPEEEAQFFLPALLEGGESVPLTVTGNSMLPFLKNGRDTVWLTPGALPKKGNIALFRRGDGAFVLHRVRKVRADGSLLMNGDAQSWCETAQPDQVLAVVTAFSRSGKKTVSASAFRIRLRDLIWYPTRPIRPFLIRTALAVRRFFKR